MGCLRYRGNVPVCGVALAGHVLLTLLPGPQAMGQLTDGVDIHPFAWRGVRGMS